MTSRPGGAQHQQQSDLGGGVAEHVRGVGDDDAPGLRGFQIHVIDTDRKIRDGFYASRQTGNSCGVQMLGVTWKQRTGAVGETDQLVGGVDVIVRIEQWLIIAAKARLDGLGQFARDHDFWLRAHERILQ